MGIEYSEYEKERRERIDRIKRELEKSKRNLMSKIRKEQLKKRLLDTRINNINMTCYFCMNPIHGIAVILEDFTKNSYEEKITKHWFSNKDCYDEAMIIAKIN